jgi:hypothetical protein
MAGNIPGAKPPLGAPSEKSTSTPAFAARMGAGFRGDSEEGFFPPSPRLRRAGDCEAARPRNSDEEKRAASLLRMTVVEWAVESER